MKANRNFLNLIFPAIMFGAITGVLTAGVIMLFKLATKYVIAFSQDSYAFLREKFYFVPLVLIAFYVLAKILPLVYKKYPRTRGCGIPSSLAVLRNIVSFKWLGTLLGVFFLSLISFLIGVPLGNEGPSVLMGVAVGKGSVRTLAKKRPAWESYTMTGGACAGFAVATGASVSGVLFAVEEAHQRISPMILIVGSVAVMFAQAVSYTFSPLLGISIGLFPTIDITILSVADVWIPLVMGIVFGFVAVLFLKYYHVIGNFSNVKLKKLPHYVKIFLVFAITLVFGLISYSFVSTGHDVFVFLLEQNVAIYGLLILLLVRTTLMLFANTNRVTGGVFLPIITLGAILASIMSQGMQQAFGLSSEYSTAILVLGVSACISAMMKMPLTAIVFALEVFGCVGNVLHLIIVVAISYAITEIFGIKGINATIINSLTKIQEETQEKKVLDVFLVVKKGCFAEYKKSKDIIWPSNLSVISKSSHNLDNENRDAETFYEGDVLHVRCETFDEEQTKVKLNAILGEQDYSKLEFNIKKNLK
ncbi:MAG: chloride channel protein [Clostridia bacterium]|nr:chloride channel protein [Clostridia bacterium]